MAGIEPKNSSKSLGKIHGTRLHYEQDEIFFNLFSFLN